MSTTRCAVRRLIAPCPCGPRPRAVEGTTAAMSSRSTAARRRRANQRAGAGLLPLFLGQMCCPCGIDIAGPLPAVVHLMQAAAQCAGADRDTMALLQIMPEQWHRPTRGLIAAAARVACQGCRQATRGKLWGRVWSSAARSVRQGGGIMGRQVAFGPPANTEPRGVYAPGRLTDRLSFSDQQHRLDPAI